LQGRRRGRRYVESREQNSDQRTPSLRTPLERQYGVHVPEHLDVQTIRQKIRMSQAEFARHFGVNKRTVQDWEQRRRHPLGPARALFGMIDREPEAVYRASCA
jgi:DNA-binding transcriptional regulator YiaG